MIPIEILKIAMIILNSQPKVLLKPKVGYPKWIHPTILRTTENKIKQVSISECNAFAKEDNEVGNIDSVRL